MTENIKIDSPHWFCTLSLDSHIQIYNGLPPIFITGVWLTGHWRQGLWLNGIWYKGSWYSGIWKEGIWKGGTWTHDKGDHRWYKGKVQQNHIISSYWLSGTWEIGNINTDGSPYIIVDAKISPKSYFKPPLTLSLNHSDYHFIR